MTLLPKLITEFLGTFFLCLTIALSSNAGSANVLAVGCLLTAIVYAGGPISAAHYNPAITVVFWLSKKIDFKGVFFYWIAQLLGALVAALLAKFVFEIMTDRSLDNLQIPKAFTAEFIGTFALAFVIINVAITERSQGNSYYGIAIGLIVIGGAYVLGPYSGAAFNPAVVLSQCITNAFSWGFFGLYLIGNFGGAILAYLAYRLTERSLNN